jgi:hypothetical protein
MLARLWEAVFKKHSISVQLENDIPLTGQTKMHLIRFLEKMYDPPSPRAFANVSFSWDWINHLRYQTTEDDFWATLGLYREDYEGVIEKTEEPRIRLRLDFYFDYHLPNWFDRWDPDDNVPVSFVDEVTFLNRLGEERLGEISYKMLDVVSQWFPIKQVPYPDSTFETVDTQTITMTPRIELAYSRQIEAQFAVNKISTQVYHDIFLPRAWDGEMDHTAGSERNFMVNQFENKFDQVAGNIAGVLEQLAVIAEQEQNR